MVKNLKLQAQKNVYVYKFIHLSKFIHFANLYRPDIFSLAIVRISRGRTSRRWQELPIYSSCVSILRFSSTLIGDYEISRFIKEFTRILELFGRIFSLENS